MLMSGMYVWCMNAYGEWMVWCVCMWCVRVCVCVDYTQNEGA